MGDFKDNVPKGKFTKDFCYDLDKTVRQVKELAEGKGKSKTKDSPNPKLTGPGSPGANPMQPVTSSYAKQDKSVESGDNRDDFGGKTNPSVSGSIIHD